MIILYDVTMALQDVYTLKARELEAGGRLRDAEKLYCSIKAYDSAITMYKQHNMWEHVIRLVAQHRKVCHAHIPLCICISADCPDSQQHTTEAAQFVTTGVV